MASIRVKYGGKTYDLTFTREAVEQAERIGFDIQAFLNGTKPATMNPLLFYSAFFARHRKIKRRDVDEIYAHIPDKNSLLKALAEMYADTLDPLVDSAEDDGKKAEWEMG